MHRRLGRGQIDLGRFVGQLRLELPDPLFELPGVAHLLQYLADLLRREGFRDEIEGAAAHRLDRRGDVGEGGEHDHRQPGRRLQQLVHHRQPVLSAELHVEEADVEALGLDEFEGARPGGRLHRLVAGGLYRNRRGPADTGFVVDNQNAHNTLHCQINAPGVPANPQMGVRRRQFFPKTRRGHLRQPRQVQLQLTSRTAQTLACILQSGKQGI